MRVTVFLPAYLRTFAGGRDRVVLDGAFPTVGNALDALGASHPGVRDRVVTEQGALRQHVHVFVGNESIRETGGLETSLRDDSEIFILPAVSGGRGRSPHSSPAALLEA
jgi:sulfur-carrier protein